MITAAGYVLKVTENRREILLQAEYASEPVGKFDHGFRAPLVVLACFADDAITHIADGRKGVSAGTGLVRLNLDSLERLERPITFAELLDHAPNRIRRYLRRVVDAGGKLPPKTFVAVVNTLLEMLPSLAARLERFSGRRDEIVARLTERARMNLAVQKETLATALQISGIGSNQITAWYPASGQALSFLDGLPQAQVREDAAVISDYSSIPGFESIRNLPFAARVFQNESDPSIRLTVIMANHLPLEQETGADLIYFNETYQSFVLVQYKSMDRGSNGPEFRWTEGDQLAIEIASMDSLLAQIRAAQDDPSPASFRLHSNPCFLKLCPRMLFNPDDKGLFKGLYLPLDLWRSLANDPVTEGPRGGRVLTYNNVGRKLTNGEFIQLVSNSWVGTTVPQSKFLKEVIENVIKSGRTVTLAVKRVLPPEPPDEDEFPDEEDYPFDEELDPGSGLPDSPSSFDDESAK